MVPIISIIGWAGSGKTTLLEKIIIELKKRGYKIGVVKHSSHDFEIDYPKKDSWRHKKAGADSVIVSGSRKISLIKSLEKELNLEEIAEKYLNDMDLILTEGYKVSDKPKILVLDAIIGNEFSYEKQVDNLIAIVSSKKIKSDLPQFNPNQIKEITDCIEKKIIKKT
ncbi:MAG: molybdopterin-guanine dinucleotide biosynthesis protein B [Candidatus Aminicenantia bacterium]